MIETNELETHLRSWALRRPSSKLKRRIFEARAAAAAVVVARPAHCFSWMAPATAALLVMAMLLNQRRCASFFDGDKPGPLVAMILTNPTAAACLSAGFGSAQNGVPATLLHWTNAGQSAAPAADRPQP